MQFSDQLKIFFLVYGVRNRFISPLCGCSVITQVYLSHWSQPKRRTKWVTTRGLSGNSSQIGEGRQNLKNDSFRGKFLIFPPFMSQLWSEGSLVVIINSEKNLIFLPADKKRESRELWSRMSKLDNSVWTHTNLELGPELRMSRADTGRMSSAAKVLTTDLTKGPQKQKTRQHLWSEPKWVGCLYKQNKHNRTKVSILWKFFTCFKQD